MINKMFGLHGRAAVVTGGSKGLGLASAEALAAAGAHVALIARHRQALQEAARKVKAVTCSAQQQVLIHPADITDEDQTRAAARELHHELGRVDILVCAAGKVITEDAADFSLASWQEVMDVNVKGVFLCCREFGRIMLQQKGGKIINFSSVRGLQGRPQYAAYAPSKGAINMLTKTLATEWAPAGVTVNAIAPTFIYTELNAYILDDPQARRKIIDRIPMNRLGEPDDLKGTIIYLASRASDFVTGQIVYVDGGWTAS